MSDMVKHEEKGPQQRRGILARLLGKKEPSNCCGMRIEEVGTQEATKESPGCCGVRIEEVKEEVEEAKASTER